MFFGMFLKYVSQTNNKLPESPAHHPKPAQSWTFSTNVVFKFSYEGYGLAPTDTIRIIETDAKCTDQEGNPNQADTSIQYGHPDNPQQVSNVPGEEWNFPTFLLTSETVRCNRVGICDEVNVKDAVVLNETHTELEFTGNPDLFDDDVLSDCWCFHPGAPHWRGSSGC